MFLLLCKTNRGEYAILSYEQALSYALIGDAVFIFGSGFSMLAKDIDGNKLPVGGQFANELCQDMSEITSSPDDLSLDMAAQDYIDFIGERALITLIKKRFSVSTFDPVYNSFATIKRAHIYTTNYDNLVERIFESGKKIKSYNILSDLRKADKGHFVLHINGYAHELEDSIDNNTFRLTYSSYDTAFFESPWYKYLRDDIRSKSAVFIIGLSFKSDLDLRRIIADDNDIKSKCFIIERPDIDDPNKRYLSRYGNVLMNGVSQFFSDLNKAVPIENNKEIVKHKFRSFANLSAPNRPIYEKAIDSDIFEMFFLGNNENKLYFQEADEQFVNLVNRKHLSSAREEILCGNSLIIHSDLGNGKTVFLHQLMYLLRECVFYVYKNFTPDWEKELNILCDDNTKKVIVFESYNLCYDQIKYVVNNNESNNVQLILLSRTAMHENCENSIYQILSDYHVKEIDLNTLKDGEIVELDSLLLRYGLWGEHSSKNLEGRIRIIRNECNSSLRDLILFLFKECEIKGRLENLLRGIDSNALKLLTLSFVNDALELKLLNDDFEIIIDDARRILRSERFKEFTLRDRNEFKVKSSVIAKALLGSKLIGLQNVVNILTDLSFKLDNLYTGNDLYSNVMRNLSSYSYLSFLFDYETDKDTLIAYYENIKELKFYARNLFFWEQYAIACVNTKEFNRAEIYFKTAYALAKGRRRDFSTFQIDNHYARFLLEKVIYNRDYDHAFNSFIEAHRLITKTDRSDLNDKYYQFRVARLYKGIFDIFYNNFLEAQKELFISRCKEIQSNLKRYIKGSQNLRHDIKECERNLLFIIEHVDQ